jgi:peptide/nickel transport system permease protein
VSSGEGAVAGGILPRSRPLLGGVAAGWMLVLGLAIAALLASAAVVVLLTPLSEATAGNLLARFKAPLEDGFLLGSDQLGRPVFARLLAGMPWSLGIALISTLISLSIGTLAGLAAAARPGLARRAIQHLVDTVIAFPTLVIAVIVIAMVGRGFWPLAMTLGLATWPIAARVVYAEALSVMKRDYVLAAELVGVGLARNVLVHVLPATRPTLLVMFAFTFADMLIAESALSFLGLGVPLTAPSWGNMLSESRQFLVEAPWMMLGPAAVIVLAVVAFNLIGDGIALRSRLRSRSAG